MDSEWVVLDLSEKTGETIKFTANLQKSTKESLPLFPNKKPDQDEFLMTLVAEIDNKQIPWLQNIKNENVEFLGTKLTVSDQCELQSAPKNGSLGDASQNYTYKCNGIK